MVWRMNLARSITRRPALRAIAGLTFLAAHGPSSGSAHHHHKKRRRCDKRCKQDHTTCDRGCDILDGDSQHFCKESCKVARSQCKSEC